MAHRLHPAQPLATGFVFTLPRQLPRRTDASAIGVQPQTDQELWVGVLSSCAAFHRGNLLVIAAQIQSPHQLPNRTYAVIVIYQLLHIHRPQEHLPTINRYQPRNSRRVAHHVRSLHTSTQPTATNFFTRSRRDVFCASGAALRWDTRPCSIRDASTLVLTQTLQPGTSPSRELGRVRPER